MNVLIEVSGQVIPWREYITVDDISIMIRYEEKRGGDKKEYLIRIILIALHLYQ